MRPILIYQANETYRRHGRTSRGTCTHLVSTAAPSWCSASARTRSTTPRACAPKRPSAKPDMSEDRVWMSRDGRTAPLGIDNSHLQRPHAVLVSAIKVRSRCKHEEAELQPSCTICRYECDRRGALMYASLQRRTRRRRKKEEDSRNRRERSS